MAGVKSRVLYEVRFYPANYAMASSRGVGFKGRLLERCRAAAVAKRLRRAGVDAFIARLRINVAPK
jgi:hypothetical protein